MTLPRWRHPVPWLAAALLILNAAIAWRMFHVEYLSQTGSGVGVIIAYARFARDNWPDLDWCRFWYEGLPFRNAYVPGVPLAAALLSGLAHIAIGRAFYIVVASMYCLGPVTLFCLAWRLTRAASWSFYAGLLYSLVSPSAFLVADIHKDLGSLFWDQRLHAMASYSDNQNVAALTLLPLAILALDVALERSRPICFVAAGVALAAVPLTNWPGAIALTFAVLAYWLAQPRAGWLNRSLRVAAIIALAYALALPWIPPSTVFATQADTQGFAPVNRFMPRHLIYAAALAAGTWALLSLTAAARAPRYLRFFLLFFFYMAAITLGWYWLGVTLLAQPHRFHLAMEMGLILSLVFSVRLLVHRWKALRWPVAVAFGILCVFQFVQYRGYARRLIRGIDITQTSEYKTALWFDRHMRDSRVMVPGSTTFWLNVFTDTPQLTGCCPQGVLNQTERIADYGIMTDLTAESRAFENSQLWFKALGVRAVAVSGARSTEVYKPFYHPHKFEGRLPVLWRDEDDVIYEVPWRYYSIAHAMEPGDLVSRTPRHGVDTDPLIRYVAAIERPEAPELQVRWPDNETILITGNLLPDQIVSVQESAHPGWRAAVEGSPRRVFADKLGLLAVVPNCSGDCTISLHFDGGVEMRAARWVNRAAIAGSILWILLSWALTRGHQRTQAPRPLRRPQLPQRFGFDLPDALARDVEFLADLFERMLALAAYAEPQPDHLLFFRRKSFQDAGGLVANVGFDHRVYRRAHPTVFDQVAQSGFAVAPDWRFERNRVARNGLQLLDFLHRDIHPAPNFVICRSSSQFLLQLARRAQELVHALVHVHRNADGAGLVCNCARNGLADPPRGVCGELVTAPVFELVGGAHQADIALLDEVQQVKSAVYVFLGDRNHQAEVCLHQVLLGALGFGFSVPDYGQGMLQVRKGGCRDSLPLADLFLQILQPLLDLRLAGGLRFDLLDFAVQLAEFLDGALDLLGKLLPFQRTKRDRTNPLRDLHLGAIQPVAPTLALPLHVDRHGLELVGDLLQLAVHQDQIREQFQQIGALFQIRGSAFFDVSHVHDVVDFVGALFQLLGQFHHYLLHQRRAADGLLHAQLTALHAPRQIHFAFAGQQRNRSHFTQIHAYRIVGVDGLFHRRGMQEIGLVACLRIEKLGIFLKVEAQGFRIVR